jgi:sulfate adenylyltransferase
MLTKTTKNRLQCIAQQSLPGTANTLVKLRSARNFSFLTKFKSIQYEKKARSHISATSATSNSFSLRRHYTPIPAHGASGELVDLVLTGDKLAAAKAEAHNYHELTLNRRQLCDLELLSTGGFSPLTGFMDKQTYHSVLLTQRLTKAEQNVLFPIPVVLDISEKQKELIQDQPSIALKDEEGNLLAILDVSDIYKAEKSLEADLVYHKDREHPYNQLLFNEIGDYYIGGKLRGLQLPIHYDHNDLRNTPKQLREKFRLLEEQNRANNRANSDTSSNNPKLTDSIVAFQTRNPLHRAHFELTINAQRSVNGLLLLHPVVGMTKPGDIDHHTRVKCYRAIMNRYRADCALLSVLPLAMRMAGPREALWHAIIRQNYGATHFILGRDHAGPGSNSQGVEFYGPYQARDHALSYQSELKIKLLPFEMMVYNSLDNQYYPVNNVPKENKLFQLSGTQVRKLLRSGQDIPEWFSFPEVVKILRDSSPPANKQGFCVFFTGLSGSGKSTVANALIDRLMELDSRAITLLDGDLVRQLLSSELGFSKEHRNLNIKRIGYVSSLMMKAGGAVIAAPIAPYQQSRAFARGLCAPFGSFIEVYISTAVEICEQRDRKGLYAKARKGLIKQFTGIDDPYEAPQKPELTINTQNVSVAEAVEVIVQYLEAIGHISTKHKY